MNGSQELVSSFKKKEKKEKKKNYKHMMSTASLPSITPSRSSTPNLAVLLGQENYAALGNATPSEGGNVTDRSSSSEKRSPKK